jgi:hypothetical protein
MKFQRLKIDGPIIFVTNEEPDYGDGAFTRRIHVITAFESWKKYGEADVIWKTKQKVASKSEYETIEISSSPLDA